MELRIYYYENLLSLKTRPFNNFFILRKFGAIRYMALAKLKIMACYRSFYDPFWYMTNQIQFGRTYLTVDFQWEAIDSMKYSTYFEEMTGQLAMVIF